MVNAKAEVAHTPSQAQIDYDKVVNDKAYTDSAKNLGKSILKRLTSIGADTKIEELNAKIAKAAGENDIPLMKSLFAELNKLEQDQKNLKDQHKTIRGNNTFETIAQAWGSEIRELALSIAVEAIKSASAAQHQANAGGETGATGKGKNAAAKANAVTTPPKTYIVTQEKTGKTAELPLRRGDAKPSKDKAVFELLGFKFNEDESLKEAGFKYKDKEGKEVVVAKTNRKALLEAVQNGGFAGFTAVLQG